MITKDALSKYVSKVIKPGSEVLEIRQLGSGFHGTGFLVRVKTEGEVKNYVLKTIREGGFGHEYPSDRAKVVIDALGSYNELPGGNKILAAGSVQEDGSLKDLGKPKDYFMLVEEVSGKDLWQEFNRIRDAGKLDQQSKDTLVTLANYLAELHSIKPENIIVADRYKKFVRDFIGSGELTLGVLDTFPRDVPFATTNELTEIVQKQVEWWQKIKYNEHRLVTMHGDFHPGNVVFTDKGIVVMDRSRTKYGDASHDVFDIVVNLINYSIMSYQKYQSPFKDAVELFLNTYLEKTKDLEMLLVAPFFMSFISIVCVHPLFYSAEWLKKQGFSDQQINKLNDSKKLMIKFNKNVLNASQFEYKNVEQYFN